MPADPKANKNAPAPLTPSTVSTTVKQAYQSKVVILHSAVGVFTRGQVIETSTFGSEITRLLKCNAIRQATHEESMLDRVDLDAASNTPKNLVHELQTKLGEKQAVIDQQEREIQHLRNLNQTAAATTDGNTVNELMTRMKDNEVIIKGLQNELEEAKKKLAEVKKS